MQAIRRGFRAIENHIKELVETDRQTYREALDAAHEARMKGMEAEIAERAKKEAMEILDELTRPTRAAG